MLAGRIRCIGHGVNSASAQTHVIPIYLDDIKFVGVPVDLIGVRFKFDPQDPD